MVIFIALKLKKNMLKDTLKKMNTKLEDVVQYTLDIHGKSIVMNDLIGKQIKIEWSGVVICGCGKKMNSFYRGSGYCYKCYWESPLASQSIFKPELCTAHLGIEERDLEWEKKFQLAPHYVYLANSSGIKVGITRGTQGVIRWMDQGASQAILLAEAGVHILVEKPLSSSLDGINNLIHTVEKNKIIGIFVTQINYS